MRKFIGIIFILSGLVGCATAKDFERCNGSKCETIRPTTGPIFGDM